jgi:hypothetical protein
MDGHLEAREGYQHPSSIRANGSESMEQARADNVIVMPQQPNDWSKLIRKMRWIGLQLAVRSLPPEQRGTVSAGPFSTD